MKSPPKDHRCEICHREVACLQLLNSWVWCCPYCYEREQGKRDEKYGLYDQLSRINGFSFRAKLDEDAKEYFKNL